MKFDTYFAITSYGLVCAAFAALALTGEVDFLSLGLYTIALAGSIYVDARGYKRLRPQEWLWRMLTIAYIPFVFLDAAFISNRILALVHMTLFVSAVKLFQHKRERDWIFLYLIGFFQLLLAASLTFNATFVASLVAYIFFFVATLAAFEIKRAGREVRPAAEEVVMRVRKNAGRTSRQAQTSVVVGSTSGSASPGRVKYFVSAATIELALVGALTLPLFFFIPRLNGGNVGGNFGEAQVITGFSDIVRLGEVASIKSSSRVVMRIKLDKAPGAWLRWRGVALDHYDGRAWSFTRGDTSAGSGEKSTFPGSVDGAVSLDHAVPPDSGFPENLNPDRDRASAPQQRAGVVRQDFYLEPLSVGTLFAARKLQKIRGPLGKLHFQNGTGTVSVDRRYGRLTYTAWSDIRTPSEEELRSDPMRAPPAKPFDLQLPSEEQDHLRLDPRIQNLAHEITRGLPNAYDRARAIEAYLKTHYSYSLDLKYGPDDPLAEFLFNGKEGHCEYFATAMVIMLRTLHIPARIVNGFQMGEYNDVSQMYVVRDRDAHSWVEAYFPGSVPGSDAWIEFDPTPSAGINDYSRAGLLARLMKYVDAAEVFWMDYIVTLDRGEQASIMISLQHKLLSFKEQVLYYYDRAKSWATGLVAFVFLDRRWSARDLITAIAGLLLLGVCLLAGSIVVSRLRHKDYPGSGIVPWWLRVFVLSAWGGAFWLRKEPRRSAILFYQQMLVILSRSGAVKRPDQTPIEFADMQESTLVRQITDIYNRVRFGGEKLNEHEARRVQRLLSELKRATRKNQLLSVPPARNN